MNLDDEIPPRHRGLTHPAGCNCLPCWRRAGDRRVPLRFGPNPYVRVTPAPRRDPDTIERLHGRRT